VLRLLEHPGDRPLPNRSQRRARCCPPRPAHTCRQRSGGPDLRAEEAVLGPHVEAAVTLHQPDGETGGSAHCGRREWEHCEGDDEGQRRAGAVQGRVQSSKYLPKNLLKWFQLCLLTKYENGRILKR
jgi:hypothetical protein